MKTTVEISDPLLREARAVAVREGVTLRTLIERGLHRVVTETSDAPPFRLRRAGFKGQGLQAGVHDAPWEAVRAMIYEGRGG